MSSSLREDFERDGMVRVPGVIAADAVAQMRAGLLARMEAVEFYENAGAMRPKVGTELELWNYGRQPECAPLPIAFAQALDTVFGANVWEPVEGELGGVAMPNLPGPRVPWEACAPAWHVDDPTEVGGLPSTVLLGFALLDRLERHGGGTVVLAGSHRRLEMVADRLQTQCTTDVALAGLAEEDPWFAAQLRSGLPPTDLRWQSAGVDLELREITGDAGDIVLMNPRCLHTTAANVSDRPRLLMRMTCLRA